MSPTRSSPASTTLGAVIRRAWASTRSRLPAPVSAIPAFLLRNGLTGQYNPAELFGASYDPGLLVAPGQIKNATAIFDPNGGRPPRQVNWNISVQRELTRDLVLEAAYVGNRGSWFRADGLVDYNANTAGRLQSFGLDINNAADRTLLTSRLDSPQVIARGFKAPLRRIPDLVYSRPVAPALSAVRQHPEHVGAASATPGMIRSRYRLQNATPTGLRSPPPTPGRRT